GTSPADGGSTVPPDAGTSPIDGGAAQDAGEAPVCTSGVMWNGGPMGPRMNPGRACISCHMNFAGEPIVQVGGTVYPTLKEVDRCYGVGGVTVVIEDANGQVFTLTTTDTGNFSVRATEAPIAFPAKVKVVHGGAERAMNMLAPHGDCNSCHTAAGKNGAPGRILLP
ncbi:MAG TPA: hypothetical protein VM580_30730, partial [Labilithrix sp.]|nr:hypothetical protein [Labilithrix sp.]